MAARCSAWLRWLAKRLWCGCASATTVSTIPEAALSRSNGRSHNAAHGPGLVQDTAAARAHCCWRLLPGLAESECVFDPALVRLQAGIRDHFSGQIEEQNDAREGSAEPAAASVSWCLAWS